MRIREGSRQPIALPGLPQSLADDHAQYDRDAKRHAADKRPGLPAPAHQCGDRDSRQCPGNEQAEGNFAE
jgi:hypothetical protein